MFPDRGNKSCNALIMKNLFSISLHNMRIQSFCLSETSSIISDLCPECIQFLHDRHLEDTFINSASIYIYILILTFGYFGSYRLWEETDCAFSRGYGARNKITRWWSNRQDLTKAQIIRYFVNHESICCLRFSTSFILRLSVHF